MKAVFWSLISFLLSSVGLADIVLTPRYDYFRGKDEALADRILLKGQLTYDKNWFIFYVDGWGEAEFIEDQRYIRRSPDRGYLQEAYAEFRKDAFYVRVGRQALRWSEMWSVPSLDVWTGRRWNRLFFDPLEEQLTYPTGLSVSYAGSSVTVDVVGLWELAKTTYPVPYPETLSDENTTGFGGRVKWSWRSFGFSALAARADETKTLGLTANYAFDRWVPKLELGWVNETQNRHLTTLGCDIFVGDWVILPEITVFETSESTGAVENQVNFYVSAQWAPRKHQVQLQLFRNQQQQDQFVNLGYGYNVTDSWKVAGFYQNYQGQEGLFLQYEDITGGSVVGIRTELTGNWAF